MVETQCAGLAFHITGNALGDAVGGLAEDNGGLLVCMSRSAPMFRKRVPSHSRGDEPNRVTLVFLYVLFLLVPLCMGAIQTDFSIAQ